MIRADAIFIVQLNGSGRDDIGMILPDFAEEKLSI